MASQLTELQKEVLRKLAQMKPRWALTGGAALAGVHLGHRSTRDLDLFWHGRAELGSLRSDAIEALRLGGLEAISNQVAVAHARLQVSRGAETVLLDLVAESVPAIEAPVDTAFEGVRILVDTPHEILVNKVCALLSRAALRDLRDVQELLRHDGNLQRALADAPRKDGGFSPLMLAWIVRELPIRALGKVDNYSEAECADLERFRNELVAILLRLTAPS